MVWLELDENDPRPAQRRSSDVGNLGRVINLHANFFEVSVKKQDIDIFHYDVEITSMRYMKAKDGEAQAKPGKQKKKVEAKRMRLAIFNEMVKKYPDPFKPGSGLGFDSEKNAYSVNAIKGIREKPSIFPVNYKHEGDSSSCKYEVAMKKVNKESLYDLLVAMMAPPEKRILPQTIMQMLEVLVLHNPSVRFEKLGGNRFFSLEGTFGQSYSVGTDKETVMGFFGSLRPVGWKKNTFLLNIDVAHAVFYKQQKIIKYMQETLGFRQNDLIQRTSQGGTLREDQKKQLVKALKNMKIRVTHTLVPRTYKVTGVGDVGAREKRFEKVKGDPSSLCTVEKYFSDHYNCRLQYPYLNLLQVGPVNRNIFMPIEVCEIAKGQKVNKKLQDAEAAEFIKKSAVLPATRLMETQKIIKELRYDQDQNTKALGFSVCDKPVSLKGRILPPQKLSMKNDSGNNQQVEPRQGVWDPRGKKFYNGMTLHCWGVVVYSSRIDDASVRSFMELLMKMGNERGMTIGEPGVYRYPKRIAPEFDFPNLKESNPELQLLVVVLGIKQQYAQVKMVGDGKGIMTQCVMDNNVRKKQPATVSNLLLKINGKLGGTNHVLADPTPIDFKYPVMVMGADVNHPPAGDKTTPSFVAVLANIDVHACRYAFEIRHQKHRTESIQDLKTMVKNLLIKFYKNSRGRKPRKIVMYRDGVSESEFKKVLANELKAMRDACRELPGENYEPEMTFIVVQKRHHTRLYCDERDSVGKSKNVPPGTTVDSIITHPTERDFYLCSHQGIQGTSKPTHYHVLWDDSDFSMNVLQTLTYGLCHVFARCTRSVSIPAPAYYAHLLAYRAKVCTQDLCPSETSSVASGDQEEDPVLNERFLERLKLPSGDNNQAFFL